MRTQGVLTPRADAVLRGLFVRPSSLREFSLRAHPTVHALAAWGDHRTRCVVMVDFLSDYLIVRPSPKSRHGAHPRPLCPPLTRPADGVAALKQDQLIRNNVRGEREPGHPSGEGWNGGGGGGGDGGGGGLGKGFGVGVGGGSRIGVERA